MPVTWEMAQRNAAEGAFRRSELRPQMRPAGTCSAWLSAAMNGVSPGHVAEDRRFELLTTLQRVPADAGTLPSWTGQGVHDNPSAGLPGETVAPAGAR